MTAISALALANMERRLRPIFAKRLARGDRGAVKAVVRTCWPVLDTVQIAARYRLTEATVANALLAVREEERVRLLKSSPG